MHRGYTLLRERVSTKSELYYQKNLPHWQPLGKIFFITYRLYGSLPKSALQKLIRIEQKLKDEARQGNASKKDLTFINKKIFFERDKLLDEEIK